MYDRKKIRSAQNVKDVTFFCSDGGSSLNLLYQDTVRKMGIDHSMIKPTKATFRGIIPGVEASCTGSIALKVVFGSPGNYLFARFNAVPHYAYRKLKMPGPRGVITVHGKAEPSFGTNKYVIALAAKTTSSTLQPNLESTARLLDTIKGLRTTLRKDTPAHPGFN